MPEDQQSNGLASDIYFNQASEEFIRLIRMQQTGQLAGCSSHLQMDGHLAVFTIKTPRPIVEIIGR
jgi:hypothetical protein